jgi:hypothetical protein
LNSLYLYAMLPEDDLQQRWTTFESKMAERLGKKPALGDLLLFIGIRESGLPPKDFTDKEKADLIQMATCTILVPGRYYELFWVDDTGWPHYRQLVRVPEMNAEQKVLFYQPYILKYFEKNKLI